ncbi:Fimbrillin-like [Prevotellaceae bacterium HUN156]|nr:Fimbrillin-like [Prevotellaceae bacterium HUN156]
MKKILVMSALVAFSAAFVACSSNDDLVQQKPEVPEEPVVGYPMHVSVADTRGTDLTTATLPGFTMYSAMKTPEEKTNSENATQWPAGVAFTNNNGNCSKVGLEDIDFPDTENTYTFYAISDPDNLAVDGESHPMKPTVTAGAVSFDYVLPTDYTTYEAGEGKTGKAEYITGGQKDLLVATATGNGNEGEVLLNFTHALSLVKKVYIRANVTRIAALLDMDADALTEAYEYKVGESLSICDVKTAGTYTFGSGWSNQATLGEFNIPMTASAFHPFDDEWYEIPLTAGDNGLYLLPQMFNGNMEDNGDGTFTLTGAYIKVGLQVFTKSSTYDGVDDFSGEYYIHHWSPSGSSAPGTTDSDDDSLGTSEQEGQGFRPFCVPLTFEILPNKSYAIRLDLTRGCYISGDDDVTLYPLFEGMTVDLN